jgi:hypothetical protein
MRHIRPDPKQNRPVQRNIRPDMGKIRPVQGHIRPVQGNIRADIWVIGTDSKSINGVNVVNTRG